MSQLPTGQMYIEPGGYLLTGVNRRYNSPSDVNMRLSKTIVSFNGAPVFCKGVYDNTKIIMWDMQEGSNDFVVESNDSRLDISSPPIGFWTYQNNAFYAARRPVRSQRQGLEVERLLYYSITMGDWTNFGRDNLVLYGFRKMLTGEYPQLADILKQPWNSIALSRTWALKRTSSSKHMLLFHRTSAVGFFNPERGEFTFRQGDATRLRRTSLANVLSKQYGGNYVVV